MFAESAPTRAEKIILGAMAALGVLMRLRVYLLGRSLWSDEALLANNFVQRSLPSLLTRPLDSSQGAPLGFIALVKLSAILFGSTDYVLRLLPFVSGALVVVCAYALAWHVFRTPVARWTFLVLICCSPILVYYTSELKQYSSDVLVALLLLWVVVAYQRWRGGLWILAGVGTCAIWLSHPSVFILTGIGITLAISKWRAGETKEWQGLAAVGLIWLINFGLDYRLSLRHLSGNQYLLDYWRVGYAPFPVQSVNDLNWYLSSALGLIFMAFQQTLPEGPEVQTAWFQWSTIALLSLVLVGAVVLVFRVRKPAVIAAVAVLANLIVSTMSRYPFRNRMILYLLPFVYLMAAMLFEAFTLISRPRAGRLLALLSVIPVGVVAVTAANITLSPANFDNIKGALQYVEAHRQPGDYLSMNAWADAPFYFYQRFYDLSQARVIAEVPSGDDGESYLKQLCMQGTLGRTWIILTHDYYGRVKLVNRLKRFRPVLASWESGKAGAYLFDFGGPGICQELNPRLSGENLDLWKP